MGRAVDGMTVLEAAAVGIEAMVELRNAAGTCRALREIGVKPEMTERLTELAAKGRSTLINCRKPDRAEIAALQHLKASAVGMSSAPEVMRCHELGMQAAVVSVITNSCCVPARLTHGEIVAAGRKASARLVQLLRRALPDLGSP